MLSDAQKVIEQRSDVDKTSEHPNHGTSLELINKDRISGTPLLLMMITDGKVNEGEFEEMKFVFNDLFNNGPTRVIVLGLSQDFVANGYESTLRRWNEMFDSIEAQNLYMWSNDGRGYFVSDRSSLPSELLLIPPNNSRRQPEFHLEAPVKPADFPKPKATEKTSVNIVVMLDISGSFRKFLPKAKESLNELVLSLREGDSITVLTVSDSVQTITSQEITNSVRDIIGIRELVDAIQISRDRGTDVVGGFLWSLNILEANDHGDSQGKILVFVTDGEPDFHPLSQQTAKAWKSPAILQETEIYVVGYSFDMKELSMHTLLHNESISYEEKPLTGFSDLIYTFRDELSSRPDNILNGGE
ncbi:MAG: vWA domain-containing protein [Nanoarchaeota archaeon]